MKINRKSFATALTALLTVLGMTAVLLSQDLAEAQVAPGVTATGSDTDSVRFSADLRAGEKPLEVVGQYAWTSINGQVVQSDYSTEPQPMVTGGNACVHGGAGAGCLQTDDVASATTVDGTMPDLDETFAGLLGIGLATTNAEVAENFTTGVRCHINEDGRPVGEAQRPTGEIRYGSDSLLSLQRRTVNFVDLPNGQFWSDYWRVGDLLGVVSLLAGMTVEVEVTPSWGWNPDTLRAHSELTVRYRGRNGDDTRPWHTFTARSECGLRMNDGTGSTGPAGMGAQALASPMLARQAPEEDPTPTSAPGTPQVGGFTSEDFLTIDGSTIRYQLLATRELGLADRRDVEDVIATISEPDAGVEGMTSGVGWQIFSAEAAGEEVPVLEITLADGAVVQARPDLPGVLLPAPDVIEPPTASPSPTAATPTTSPTSTTTTSETTTTVVEETSEPAEPTETTTTATEPSDD